jgi:isocitrate dehydrogenase
MERGYHAAAGRTFRQGYLRLGRGGGVIEKGIAVTIQQKQVTYVLERLMPEAALLKCAAFGNAIIGDM